VSKACFTEIVIFIINLKTVVNFKNNNKKILFIFEQRYCNNKAFELIVFHPFKKKFSSKTASNSLNTTF
jgi:hypothetical protein